MANKSKQKQSGQLQVNDYERHRLLRIKENQTRVRDLGLKRIANSLTSLVDSQGKKKKKMKPTYDNMRDVSYNPNYGDDSEEDQVETSTVVSTKQRHPKYIAPMSMNKIVNLAKQRRVTALKGLDSKTMKENHSKSTLTMGEFLSSNKGTRQKEVTTQDLAKATGINHRSKKRLDLVDEDDDEDDDLLQDFNEKDMDVEGLEDDENEEYIVTSQDDEYEDMNVIAYANNDDTIQEEDIYNRFEDEDDALAQDQLHQHELENRMEISKTTTRGPTMLHDVHTRKANDREVIICNEFGQPVGPTIRDGKDVVGRFTRFLGTIARNHSYAPLIHSSWQKVPHKDKMWEYVLEKYDVPDASKTWVLKSIGQAYKVHKCRFKKKHFYQYKDNKTRLKNRPKSIPADDFTQLLRLWNDKHEAKRCLRAKESRMSQKNMHTAGPKSFARIREEMKNDNPNKELPTLTQLFERTRKRTEGSTYVDTYDDTARKIEQMKNYKPVEDGNPTVDPFLAVMKKENYGYRRLYGRGVTNTLIKKLDSACTSYMIPEGLAESLKENVEVGKNQLLEMQKEMERNHEIRKAELEAMQKDINNQRENLEAMIMKVMEQLPNEDQDE